MPETGGPTSQSGIQYQNSVTALYLGRLCDATCRPDNLTVTHVRVESPDRVDDTIVTFADGHQVFIQAKEKISRSNIEWNKLWRDFDIQFRNDNFQKGRDRLIIHIGNFRDEHDVLRELCERARTCENYNELQKRLNKKQKKLVDKIKRNISPELLQTENLTSFLRHIDVEIWTLVQIERDLVPIWIPRSNRTNFELFRLLRDRVGGEARVRGSFNAHELRRQLSLENPDFAFIAPPDLDELRLSIKDSGSLIRYQKHTIGNTGHHITREIVSEISTWAREDGNDSKNVAILIDQAGIGKTVAFHDLLCELENNEVDILAIKADQKLSDLTKMEDVQKRLGLPIPIEQALESLSKLRRVVILIDQIDALSLSLAHDQNTLNMLLDLIARWRRIPNVRIVISCRLFDWNSDPRLQQIDFARQFNLGLLSEDETQEALMLLNVDYNSLSKLTRELLRTPLHLDLLARAIENSDEPIQTVHNVTSLQALYGLIWQNVVLKHEPQAPSKSHRIEALYLLTDYMDREQRVSVPYSVIQTTDAAKTERVLNWLASSGILIQSNAGWLFLHQTFFDYCYSRRFVERGDDIVRWILESEQGLTERRKLVQTIQFLRGSDPVRYMNGLTKLLYSTNLRCHLYDLLLRWFGALPTTNDDEWVLAEQILLDPKRQSQFLLTMYGNISWFDRLRETFLNSWLSSDETADQLAIPYLISMVDITQDQVIDIVSPYWGRNNCTSSKHLRQNKHSTKRVFSAPIYTGVYTLSRRA